MARHLAFVELGLALSLAACAAPSSPPTTSAKKASGVHPLPSDCVEDRFYVEPKLASGPKLRFFTDSGGGLFIHKAKVTELGLPVESKEMEGRKLEVVRLGPFADGATIPLPAGLADAFPVYADKAPFDEPSDGMLGQAWFAGHIWSFDYPGRRLVLRDALPPHDPAHEVPLGFPVDKGERQADFPRIVATIDGQPLDLLFDTGATVKLTPSALAALNDGHRAERATSFIVKTIFDGWHAKHPDWRVVDNADANAGGEPMILVPVVLVAGFEAHDVWFTRRQDKNFHEFMSSFMDKQVEGALGGSALRGFRVSVDYPNAVAVFEQP